MSEERDKSDPEDSGSEDSGLEEIEIEESWRDAPSVEPDERFEIVMEIEREENWPPPPPRNKG